MPKSKGKDEEAVFSYSAEETVESWNRGAERLYGYTAQEMIGQSVARLVPDEGLREFAELGSRMARGESVGRVDTVHLNKDGVKITVSLVLSPVRGSSGRLAAVGVIARKSSGS